MEPVSIENLHNNKNTRNFWCRIKNRGYWSACGSSAEAEFLRFTGEQEKSVLEAGFMWQKLTRTSAVHGLKAEITSFVTVDGAMEVMMTELTNITEEPLEMTPIAVMPVYGRSADNIRDHRHVTSLLHRICTTGLWGGGDACDVVCGAGASEESYNVFCIWFHRRGRGTGSFLPDRRGVCRGGRFLSHTGGSPDRKAGSCGRK